MKQILDLKRFGQFIFGPWNIYLLIDQQRTIEARVRGDWKIELEKDVLLIGIAEARFCPINPKGIKNEVFSKGLDPDEWRLEDIRFVEDIIIYRQKDLPSSLILHFNNETITINNMKDIKAELKTIKEV